MKDWHIHDTCSNYNFAILKPLFFLSQVRDSQISSFYKRCVIHLPSDLQKDWKCKHTTHNCCLMQTLFHLGLDIIVVNGNHINILIPEYISLSTAFHDRHGLRRTVMSRYEGQAQIFHKLCCPLHWQRWMLTMAAVLHNPLCCFLLSVSFVEAADDLQLYFELGALYLSCLRIRED